jgi:arylsulfatase A-like enzyme
VSVQAPRFATLALCITCVAALFSCGGEQAERKNVVLVVVDTMRADRASLYGYDRETTPEISEWAEGGAVFERALAASSWTVPSMGMLLTGRYRVGGGKALDAGNPLLSSTLAGEGYRTVGIVANPVLNKLQGFTDGYESYDLILGKQDMSDPLHPGSWTTQLVVEKALRWLREERDERPFMLYLHLMDPHFPYEPDQPEAFDWGASSTPARRKRYDDALDSKGESPVNDTEYQNLERLQAAYDAEILQVDAGLGVLFDYLDESGLTETTIVVLTGDHGEGLWQRPTGDGWINESPLQGQLVSKLYRGHGEHLFDELLHVPLVLRGPGVQEGVRSAQPVSLVDVVPTLLSLLDISPRQELHGRPLFDEATGERESRDHFSICSRGMSITEGGRWKLHLPSDRSRRRGADPLLFDLEADPQELRPLKEERTAVRLTEKLHAWENRYRKDVEQRSLEEQRALLLQMGYVGLAEDLTEEMSLEEKQRALKLEREQRKAAESSGLSEEN